MTSGERLTCRLPLLRKLPVPSAPHKTSSAGAFIASVWHCTCRGVSVTRCMHRVWLSLWSLHKAWEAFSTSKAGHTPAPAAGLQAAENLPTSAPLQPRPVYTG